MISLGIDPSLTAYGWALHDSSENGKKRRIRSGHEGTFPSSVPVARFIHFRTLVQNLLVDDSIEAVGIESPAYSAGPFQTVHFGLMMFSLEAIFEKRRDCVLFDPSTLKALARGDAQRKGLMSKMDMQRCVQMDTFDAHIIDNNEADAYLIAKYAARFLEFKSGKLKPEELTASERRVFLERRKTVKTLTGKKVRKVAHIFRENSRFFEFSRVPSGQVNLPNKLEVRPELLEFLESLQD